jgi:hypothetical protein
MLVSRLLIRGMPQACTVAGKLNTFSCTHSQEEPAPPANSCSEQSDDPQQAAGTSEAGADACGQRCPTSGCFRPAWLPVICNVHALHEFYDHADNSNDVFRVAARAVATVASTFFMRIAVDAAAGGEGATHRDVERDGALLEAWRPFQAVFKAIWWEQVPMPEDLSDEAAWRSQLKCGSVFPCICCSAMSRGQA